MSKQPAIEETNTSISKYMGASIKTSAQMASGVGGIDRDSDEMWADFGGSNYIKIKDVDFHCSWNSLMQVVEKMAADKKQNLQYFLEDICSDGWDGLDDIYDGVTQYLKTIKS